MNASPHSPTQERAERHERLRLLCAVDRARLRLVWRMPVRPGRTSRDHSHWASSLLALPALGAFLPMLPGRIGRAARFFGHGASLFRSLLRATAA